MVQHTLHLNISRLLDTRFEAFPYNPSLLYVLIEKNKKKLDKVFIDSAWGLFYDNAMKCKNISLEINKEFTISFSLFINLIHLVYIVTIIHHH